MDTNSQIAIKAKKKKSYSIYCLFMLLLSHIGIYFTTLVVTIYFSL